MEKQFKDCHNEELQKKLDKIITKAKYGSYKPIIDEVFQRRAYEFGDLPEFDIDKEIDREKVFINTKYLITKKEALDLEKYICNYIPKDAYPNCQGVILFLP